ncbi:hypothetical protein [Paenibacillus polymyxa]|uniref:hypothetical protein n=1 Tax=Paenibacillus polymyxa TaxID=1406 RepID=UPI0004DF3938|nr:hypothetical protein [Paenibacillus polymyxa]MBE3650927.1 hypothetical protein [Paenibacillus polymyxa]
MDRDQRWWEFYLVRYFVGAVVGTIIVLLLVFGEGSKVKDILEKVDAFKVSVNNFQMVHLWLYGFLGLAYCYIASGPILLLHAVRGWVFKTDRGIYKYYNQLAEHRAKREKNDAIKEYVESYKHLREHGNAFFIVLMEIILGVLLFWFPKIIIISVIGIWVVAGALVWFIGTYLERKLNEFTVGKVLDNPSSNSSENP